MNDVKKETYKDPVKKVYACCPFCSANKIKEAFADWIYADPNRREDLEKTYNRLFNQIRLPSYDGSFLKFPGMNPTIELRPHQKNAVARIAGTGNSTLLHHVVGSGKDSIL